MPTSVANKLCWWHGKDIRTTRQLLRASQVDTLAICPASSLGPSFLVWPIEGRWPPLPPSIHLWGGGSSVNGYASSAAARRPIGA